MRRAKYLSEVEAVAACAVYEVALRTIATESDDQMAVTLAENALKEMEIIFVDPLGEIAKGRMREMVKEWEKPKR